MMKLVLDPIKQNCVFLKVKSHVDDPADWEEHGMTRPAYLCNLGADKAADAQAKILQTEKGADVVRNDSAQWRQTYQLALRIGAIEADVFEKYDSIRETVVATPSNTNNEIITKRKYDEAFNATKDSKNAHRLYISIHGWTLCRDCPARSESSNYEYWLKKYCTNEKEPGT